MFIYYFALFYVSNGTFGFHLIMGQLISLCFLSCSGLLLILTQRLSQRSKDTCWLNQRFWGFCPQTRCLAWGSNRFPDAYEDYSGVVSWLSFVQGVLVFHFWQSMDFRGFEFHFLVHVCRDKCTVVRIGSILVSSSILLCISSIKCNLETLSREIHREDCKNSVFH